MLSKSPELSELAETPGLSSVCSSRVVTGMEKFGVMPGTVELDEPKSCLKC
jgi:hypothetical protein